MIRTTPAGAAQAASATEPACLPQTGLPVVNDGRLIAQVVAESGRPADDVALAQYLRQCAAAGRTLEQAADLIDRDAEGVRDFCCQWQISFGDARLPPAVVAERAEVTRLERQEHQGTLTFAGGVRLRKLRRKVVPIGRLA